MLCLWTTNTNERSVSELNAPVDAVERGKTVVVSVGTKDSVFQSSSDNQHAAELFKVLSPNVMRRNLINGVGPQMIAYINGANPHITRTIHKKTPQNNDPMAGTIMVAMCDRSMRRKRAGIKSLIFPTAWWHSAGSPSISDLKIA